MKGLAIVLAGILMCASTQASVVMTGSRIIYPVDSREVVVVYLHSDPADGKGRSSRQSTDGTGTQPRKSADETKRAGGFTAGDGND